MLAAAIALTTAFKAKSLAHWLFSIGLAVLAGESFCSGLAADAIENDSLIYWQRLAFACMSLLPSSWLMFSLTYSRGNYKQFLSRWRYLLWASLILPVVLAVGFSSELVFVAREESPNPLLRLGTPGLALTLLFLLSAVLVIMNLESTFRATVGTMRWRVKFMILGLGMLFAVRAYTSTQLLLFRSVHFSILELNSGALLLASILVLRSLFRTGHFDLNVYPSQAVLHNSLTVLLAGVYLTIVGVLAKVVAFLGGDNTSFERKAFVVLAALVLLTVLLLSDRVRLYSKRFVSRHFQRPLYDYRTVWRTFTQATASRVEQADLCNQVVKLVSDVFQALSVSIWLVDERKEKLVFAASTFLSLAKAGDLTLEPSDAAEVIKALTTHPEPVDLDSSQERWAAALRRSHPEEFRKGGNRICVPMIA
ncbi:MAG TPA: histidine kinase N-terminal 7TM domain-containing protein, partial [Candidatus Angelobacter sp.]|nr:histidine kinase N-terminal 7TM domain-containing protein [Candidatus Angelobacter sp.]